MGKSSVSLSSPPLPAPRRILHKIGFELFLMSYLSDLLIKTAHQPIQSSVETLAHEPSFNLRGALGMGWWGLGVGVRDPLSAVSHAPRQYHWRHVSST